VVGASALVIVVALEDHPYFHTTAVPAAVDDAACRRLVRDQYGFGEDLTNRHCSRADSALWLDITVRNTGDQTGFLPTCSILGFDPSGAQVFVAEMKLGPIQYPPGPGVEPGRIRTIRWYVRVKDLNAAEPIPRGRVERYEARCPAVEYDGPVPV
jgi:hypothetical protein